MRLLPHRFRPLPAAAAAVVLLGTLGACSDDGDASASGDDGGGVTCSYPSDGRGAAREVEPPPEQAQFGGDVEATVELSQGELGTTLDAGQAPCAVNSFVSLAEQGYFDDTPCHRLTTEGIYVLQCGDPTGTGTGGPGYSFDDELSGDEEYPAGTIAMANAGQDTNGSQFFLVYEDTPLPPQYTVLGSLDDGSLDLLDDIAANGTEGGAPDGAPAEDVTIEAVTVAR